MRPDQLAVRRQTPAHSDQPPGTSRNYRRPYARQCPPPGRRGVTARGRTGSRRDRAGNGISTPGIASAVFQRESWVRIAHGASFFDFCVTRRRRKGDRPRDIIALPAIQKTQAQNVSAKKSPPWPDRQIEEAGRALLRKRVLDEISAVSRNFADEVI